MRRALIYSLVLHVAVGVIAYASGLLRPTDLPRMETAMIVDVVPVAEKSNVPVRTERPAAAKSETKKPAPAKPDEARALERAAPKPKVAPPPAKPAAPAVAAPAPAPAPAPSPAPALKAAEAKPKPAPSPKPAPVAAPSDSEPTREAAKPRRKPEVDKTAPSSFESVLKTVESLGQRSPSEDKAEKPSAEPAAGEAQSRSRSSDYQAGEPVTISEIDLVRRQIERCWNLPAGARGAENMVVSVRVEMNIDGTPGAASVIERERMGGDATFRAAAESAVRAVLNPRCHPFALPREKYDSWKTMTLVFDPKEMFGT